MIITTFGFKGGVAKTTTAVHIAGALEEREPGSVILADGDLNRSAIKWKKRGKLTFPVVDEKQQAKASRDYKYLVIDTQGRPDEEGIKIAAGNSDFLVLPTPPATMPIEALLETLDALKGIGASKYSVLLSIVPPRPSRDGEDARADLEEAGIPVFKTFIRRAKVIENSPSLGVLVRDMKAPNAKEHWQDFLSLSREIVP